MLFLLHVPQDDVTFTGAVNGDIYMWRGHTLSKVVGGAHSGPVMVMYTCLEDGLVLSAGKERYIQTCTTSMLTSTSVQTSVQTCTGMYKCTSMQRYWTCMQTCTSDGHADIYKHACTSIHTDMYKHIDLYEHAP